MPPHFPHREHGAAGYRLSVNGCSGRSGAQVLPQSRQTAQWPEATASHRRSCSQHDTHSRSYRSQCQPQMAHNAATYSGHNDVRMYGTADKSSKRPALLGAAGGCQRESVCCLLRERCQVRVRVAGRLTQIGHVREHTASPRSPVGRRHKRHTTRRPVMALAPLSLASSRPALVDRSFLFVRLSEAPHLHCQTLEAAVGLPPFTEVAVAECSSGLRHALPEQRIE